MIPTPKEREYMERHMTEAEQATARGRCIVPGCEHRAGVMPVTIEAVHTPSGAVRSFSTPHKGCSRHATERIALASSYVARQGERMALRLIVHIERGWEPDDVRLRVVIGGTR